MGWLEGRASVMRYLRAAAAIAVAALTAGCFQPLYGTGPDPTNPGVRDALAAIDIEQIPAAANTSEAHLAVEIRNDLLFNFTGGGHPPSPTPPPQGPDSPARHALHRTQAPAPPH